MPRSMERLSLFEKAFLSQLEQTIVSAYDVASAKLVPGRLTEDVPVYIPTQQRRRAHNVCGRSHPEITKLDS